MENEVKLTPLSTMDELVLCHWIGTVEKDSRKRLAMIQRALMTFDDGYALERLLGAE